MVLHLFDAEIYEDTAAKIGFWKAQLPQEDLHDIAKEVLNRVSARYNAADLDKAASATSVQIDQLAQAMVGNDANAGMQLAMDLLQSGKDAQEIYLSYLAAAAARIGEWWEQDELSLLDVSIGTSRIYGVIRAMAKPPLETYRADQRSAIFASIPGETHTLGIQMAADLFRRRGFEIDLLVGMSHDEIVSHIAASDIPIVGLSAGGDHSMSKLARLILAIRVERPAVLIFVSGKIVEEAPTFLDALSLDGVVKDVPDALALVDTLWEKSVP